jgi:hypothetical protein
MRDTRSPITGLTFAVLTFFAVVVFFNLGGV